MGFKIGRGGRQEEIYRPASQGDCQCLVINIFKRDKSNQSVSEGPVHAAPEAEKWSQEGSVGRPVSLCSHDARWEAKGRLLFESPESPDTHSLPKCVCSAAARPSFDNSSFPFPLQHPKAGSQLQRGRHTEIPRNVKCFSVQPSSPERD